MIEYRIGWAASSNISFRGFTDWEPWEGEDVSIGVVEDSFYKITDIPEGLSIAIEASGFEWWVETRKLTRR